MFRFIARTEATGGCRQHFLAFGGHLFAAGAAGLGGGGLAAGGGLGGAGLAAGGAGGLGGGAGLAGGGATRLISCLCGGGGAAGFAGGATGLTSGFANFCPGFAKPGSDVAGVRIGDVGEVRLSCSPGLSGCAGVTDGLPGAAGFTGFSSCVLAVGDVSLGLPPFAAGFTAAGAAVWGAVATGAAGVLPLPGTGNAFSLWNCCGRLVVFAGVTGAVPGLAVALIAALCGAGNFPSRISEDRCATLFGSAGVPAAVPAGGDGLLITVLMTVVL